MADPMLLNRYQLDEPIGQGGMGVVYRGQDTLLKRTVAIKVLSKTSLDAVGKARFLSEAQSAARLNHPNIVTVFDAGEAAGFESETTNVPFIVMELVPGKALYHCTTQSLSEALDWVRQICVALEHAHAEGIIHRDLKLENVLLTPNGTIKLMDFGLARSNMGPRLTEEGMVMGTFLYMAPELLMGEEASIQSDLYALGVMTYELACGQPPFRSDDPLALISQHLHATPVPPSTHNPAIPVEIETLILRLLSKQPGDRPVSAVEVRKILEMPTTPREAAGLAGVPLDRVALGRLVARERELAEAIQMFHLVQQGESSVLLIAGEPGVGKSRLVRELTVQVQIAQGITLIGACYPDGGIPYVPFAQMILNVSDWPNDLSTLVLADLINLAPGLRVRYPELPPNPHLDPQIEQQRMYESAFTFFSRLAQSAPLLLVLEDVHWADGGSLDLVRSLARRFKQTSTPVLIVLTFREVELTEQRGLAELLNNWDREHLAIQLKLQRLDRQGTQKMLEVLFSENVSSEFADGIYRETEGNPFFIEEMCKALIESHQVYRENGSWQRHSTTSIVMPRSIRMAIQARLKNLTTINQDVLHLAAVLGRRFEFDVLAMAAEQEEDILITALEEIEKAQLLGEIGRKGGGTFEFTHAIIPATLVEELSGMRRRRLHRQVITALERFHPDDYKALAFHCLEASEDERALNYLVKAAEHAKRAYANAEAISNYQQALALINDLLHEKEKIDSLHQMKLKLLEDLGEVLTLAGQHEEASQVYQDALALAPSGDPLWHSRLYRRIGKNRVNLKLFDEATQAYDLAEQMIGAEPEEDKSKWKQEWITLQLDRLHLDYWRGKVDAKDRLFESIRATIDEFGTLEQQAAFYYHRALIATRRSRYVISDVIIADLQKAVTIARDLHLGSMLNETEFSLGFVLLWRLELLEAEKQLKAALKLCEMTGDVTIQTRCLIYLSMVYRKRGDIENVLNYAAQYLQVASIGQTIEYISMAQANQAWAARRQGNLQEARTIAFATWERFQTTAHHKIFPWVIAWPLLSLCLEQGQIKEAVDYARELCNPHAQPQPIVVDDKLQAAIQAWEQGQPAQAASYLHQASVLAEPLGYL